jgi:hypothetical protein
VRFAWVDASSRLVENSSFPYGFNDGPVWAGKGATISLQGGIAGRVGPLSYEVAPVAFLAQNAEFALAPTPLAGNGRFSSIVSADAIDRPQRFGDDAYARVDAGNSTVRVDRFGLAAGATTAAAWWGPAAEHPIVLGNHAGGFPRIFAGTSAPVKIGFLRVHGQLLWGRVDESRVAVDTGLMRRHFVTGIVGVMQMSGAPGLEIGANRFFHIPWPTNGWRHAPWSRPFQQFIRAGQKNTTSAFGVNEDNQLASAFIRWAPPGAGAEVYGEFGRDDRNSELQDLAQEPDHISAYMFGIARQWRGDDGKRITVVRGELLNSRISRLVQARPQEPWYVHGGATSHGHTQYGQVLGSAGAFGGGATALIVDRYVPSGRYTIRWDRVAQATPRSDQGLPISEAVDLTHAIGVERLRFTPRGEITLGGAIVKEFNRNFMSDAWNLSVHTSYRRVR